MIVLVYTKTEGSLSTKMMIFTHLLLPTVTILARNDRTGDNKTFEDISLAITWKFRQKGL